MRVSNTPRRHRGRNNTGRRNNNSQNNPYDNKNENKIKGNAIQVHEKYQSLARDAISSGDIVKAEYYFQHAEHYHRVHKSSINVQLERKQKLEKNIVAINNKEIAEENIAELSSNNETKKNIIKD